MRGKQVAKKQLKAAAKPVLIDLRTRINTTKPSHPHGTEAASPKPGVGGAAEGGGLVGAAAAVARRVRQIAVRVPSELKEVSVCL